MAISRKITAFTIPFGKKGKSNQDQNVGGGAVMMG